MIFTEFVAGNFETGISDHLAQEIVIHYGKNKQANKGTIPTRGGGFI